MMKSKRRSQPLPLILLLLSVLSESKGEIRLVRVTREAADRSNTSSDIPLGDSGGLLERLFDSGLDGIQSPGNSPFVGLMVKRIDSRPTSQSVNRSGFVPSSGPLRNPLLRDAIGSRVEPTRSGVTRNNFASSSSNPSVTTSKLRVKRSGFVPSSGPLRNPLLRDAIGSRVEPTRSGVTRNNFASASSNPSDSSSNPPSSTIEFQFPEP